MNKHYLVLDAARGIAALVVMLFHVQKYIYPNVVVATMPDLFHRGFLAVDLFFLMSGFVIARSYEVKLLNDTMSFSGFVWTRLVRLWPLYIVGTLLGFIYAMAKSGVLMTGPFHLWPNIEALTANAVFLPNLSDRTTGGIFPFDPAAWSLAYEWAINLAYAIWAVRQSTTRLAVVAAVSAVALVPCAISHGSLDMGWWGASSALLGGGLRSCFAFTLGVVIYRLLSSQKPRIPSINPAALLAVLVFVLLTPIASQNVYYDLFCDFLIFPVFVILACYANIPACLNRLFADLGRLSYALYILHNPFMSWLGGAWKVITHKELASMPALTAPPFVVAIIIGSFVTAAYFDEPVRLFLRRSAAAAGRLA